MTKEKLNIVYVPIADLKPAEYNPRKHDEDAVNQLKESIARFGVVDPVIVNSAEERKNVVIGGHFRLEVMKNLAHTEVPVVYVNISDIEKEKELNLRLNKNQGEWDFELLAKFDDSFLSDIGFDSEELDMIFDEDAEEDAFDLEAELKKLDIEVNTQPGDVYDLDGSRLMCGNSMVEADVLKLMSGEKADMVMTDPPYRLDYLKKGAKPSDGFGANKNRRYLGTDELPENFTELWMGNVFKVAQKDFSIICYENWKNVREIWNVMEKYWKVRNMIVWHVPNRNQGAAGKHKFYSKHDIAVVGTSENREIDTTQDDELIENEYETALFAIQGSPHWESYGKGKKYCPTDFIEHRAATKKSSGQGIIFGTKPIEILIPYIKVLTKRHQLVLEPFGGSGSTLIASIKIGRRCFIMEKSPVYTEIIKRRWEIETGKTAIKLND